jgi:uncharacterized protein (DUF1684 family)
VSQNPTYLDLYDYRLRVAEMYGERNQATRAGEDPVVALDRFRTERDNLFRTHPQSALDDEQKRSFRGLDYFPYAPEAVVEAVLEPVEGGARLLIHTSGEESMPMVHAATARFTYADVDLSLPVYWIEVYGGGLFLPFRDATAPEETYGGGRYLFDTVKGSDFIVLEARGASQRVLLDFNYAYNPSCAYNYRWVCPLAPPENRIDVPIRAGERRYAP